MAVKDEYGVLPKEFVVPLEDFCVRRDEENIGLGRNQKNVRGEELMEKKRRNKYIKLIMGVVAGAAAITLSSCGAPKETNVASISSVEVSVSEEVNDSVQTPVVEVTEPVSRVDGDDFYQFANKDWIESHELESDEYYVSKGYKEVSDLIDYVEDVLSSKNPEDFGDNPGMANVVRLYNQYESEREAGVNYNDRLKAMIEEIQKVKSVDEFYSLLEKPEYFERFSLLQVAYNMSDSEYHIPEYYGDPIFHMFNGLTEEEEGYYLDHLSAALMAIGISENDAKRIESNRLEVNRRLVEYYGSSSGYITPLDKAEIDTYADTAKRLLKLDENNGYTFIDRTYMKPVVIMYIGNDYVTFLDKLISKENLQLAKDCLCDDVFCAYYIFASDDAVAEIHKLGQENNGVHEYGEIDTELLGIDYILGCDKGIIADYYVKNQMDQKKIDTVNELFKLVKDETCQLIRDNKDITAQESEKLRVKVNTIKPLVGCYEKFDRLEDFEPADNALDSYFAWMRHLKRYNQENFLGADKDILPDKDLFYINAYYNRYNNKMIINTALIEAYVTEEASFETLLGTVGEILAHEIGHSLDSNGIFTRPTGAYDNFLSDETLEKYWAIYDKMYEDLNGKETSLGNVIAGNMITNETFADLLAMKVCLRILERQDNPNYTEFFTSYAGTYAEKMTKEYENNVIRTDYHLLGRERSNYVLSRFARFYDERNEFNLLPDSKFYVSPEERIDTSVE